MECSLDSQVISPGLSDQDLSLSISRWSLKFMFTLTSAKNVSSVYYPSREFYSCHEPPAQPLEIF